MEELRKSYKAGIAALICAAIFIILNIIMIFFDNYIAILTLNVIGAIFIILTIATYFRMMTGYIYIGRKYSKLISKSTYAILSIIVLEILLLMITYFASIENNTTLITILSILLIILFIIFAAAKIIFGIAILKTPVKSNTKTTLSVFSILFGVSMLTVVGTIFLPYIKIMEVSFQILFLKDTYLKSHSGKKKRNIILWLVSLLIYILLIGLLTYLFWPLILEWKMLNVIT